MSSDRTYATLKFNRMKTIKRYACLVLSLLFLFLFVSFIAPVADNFPPNRPLVEFIDENDIDASALFYTEVDEFAYAESQLYNTLKYLPESRLNELSNAGNPKEDEERKTNSD